jgi:hypothetical protein
VFGSEKVEKWNGFVFSLVLELHRRIEHAKHDFFIHIKINTGLNMIFFSKSKLPPASVLGRRPGVRHRVCCRVGPPPRVLITKFFFIRSMVRRLVHSDSAKLVGQIHSACMRYIIFRGTAWIHSFYPTEHINGC